MSSNIVNRNKSTHNAPEDLAQKLFATVAFMLGLFTMGVAFFIAHSEGVRDPNITNWQGAIWVEILIAIGTSIISSIIFYFIYSRTAEKYILKSVAETSTEYALSLFRKQYKEMLPSQIFPATNLPTKRFDSYYNPLLEKSKTYRYKGDSANYTVFRLAYLLNSATFLKKEITLLLLDPREQQLFEERAQIELSNSMEKYSREHLKVKTNKMRMDVYVSLVALFDERHRLNVKVAFHKELMFFRSEIFDDGIFVTYYLGGEFPATYLYHADTLVYKAYLMNFRQNDEPVTLRLSFNNRLGEKQFITFLNELGNQASLEDLRQMKEKRFAKYQEMLRHKM